MEFSKMNAKIVLFSQQIHNLSQQATTQQIIFSSYLLYRGYSKFQHFPGSFGLLEFNFAGLKKLWDYITWAGYYRIMCTVYGGEALSVVPQID